MKDCLTLLAEVFVRRIIWILLPGRRTQEILMLRKELQVLKRQVKRPKFSSWDRLFLVSLLRLNSRVTSNIVTIKPSTVLAWHKRLAARKWTYAAKRVGRPPTKESVRSLVIEMKRNNPRWGARKIKGELRKVGVILSKSTILTILKDAGFSPRNRRYDESWKSFLASHGARFFACDFLTVETAFLKRLYIFVLMDVGTREILSTAVTSNPTRSWLETVVRSCLMGRENLPKYLVSDRDGIYGEWFGEFLDECYSIRLYRTPPRSPNCNAHVERWNRTLREELLDRRIVFGERDLHRLVSEYAAYYNRSRPHQSLGLNSPKRTHGSGAVFNRDKIRRKRVVDGLVVDYSLAA